MSLSDLILATHDVGINILPLLSIDKVRLLSGVYGPFIPPRPAEVPLWLALYLKRKNKVILIPPEWMEVEVLSETLRVETSQPGFAEMPFYWIGVSTAILKEAEEDVRDVGKVRGLLKDIREARQSKVLQGVGMVNAVHLEIAELRPFFSTAFNHLRTLRIEKSPEQDDYSQSLSLPTKADQSDSGYATGDRRPPRYSVDPDNTL